MGLSLTLKRVLPYLVHISILVNITAGITEFLLPPCNHLVVPLLFGECSGKLRKIQTAQFKLLQNLRNKTEIARKGLSLITSNNMDIVYTKNTQYLIAVLLRMNHATDGIQSMSAGAALNYLPGAERWNDSD